MRSDGDTWEVIDDLFERAVRLPAGERTGFLERSGAEERVRAEVESLLDSHDRPLEFLETGVGPPHDDRVDPRLGRRIGPYLLTRRLASGGTASVYVGQRADDVVEQGVAVKLLHVWSASASARRRFQEEWRTLARLSHPFIAHLIDAGFTDDGVPYLIMEFVDGLPIDVYCDDHRLTVAERLELFQKVCDAVQYAHQALVVHRDLKPSNILVNERGEPRLLDFGIATVLGDAGVEEEPVSDRTVRRMMTPDYASPEQVRGEPVTTRSDVYSLGVVLYEILTGERPFHRTGRTVTEVERAVCEEEALAPSAVVGACRSESAVRAAHRGASVRRLVRLLRGDLDAIVGMALQKDPDRRYQSVQHLKEDCRRHPARLPVHARPATVGYRLVRSVQRHRVVFASALLVFASLVGAVAVSTHQRAVAEREARAARSAEQRASEEAAHAATEATSAGEVVRFLSEALLIHAPERDPDDLARAAALVGRQAERVRRRHADVPHLRANQLDALGQVLMQLSLFDESRELLDEAAAARESAFGADSLESALSLASRGHWCLAQRDYEGAREALTRRLELHRSFPGQAHSDVAGAANDLAVALRHLGQLEEAEALHREALDLRRREFGPGDALVAESLNNLAAIALDRGDFAAAIQAHEECLEIRRAALGESDVLVAQSLNNLATAVGRSGDLTRARQLFEEALEVYERGATGHYEEMVQTRLNLVQVLVGQGDLRRARLHLEEHLPRLRERLGDEHPLLADLHGAAARLEENAGAIEAAWDHWDRCLAIRQVVLPAGHPRLAATLVDFGVFLANTGENDQAESMLREGLEILEECLPEGHDRLAIARINLASCLINQEQTVEARTLLAQGLEQLQRSQPADSPALQSAREQWRRLEELELRVGGFR